MTRRAIPVVPALLASVGVCGAAAAQTPGAVTIQIDANAAGTSLERVWAFHGYDEANYTTTPEGEELLRTLARAHSAPVRIRKHFLLNTGAGAPGLKWGSTDVYSEDAAGNPGFDFALLDPIMDATLDAGALPLVEIGFMPQALSTRPEPYRNTSTYALDGGCFYPPKDYSRWAALVSAWAAHVKDRYAGAEASWQWELWNEPDIGYWHGTFEEYARLYDYTEAALHAVLPEASLGGPAVARVDGDFLSQFLRHCSEGTNAVTGQTGTRLDMVSFHAKGGVRLESGHVQMDLGNQLRLHRSGFDAVAQSATFARTPIVISEADPDGCAACLPSFWPEYAYRHSAAYGAYEVEMMKRTLELAHEMGVNLRGVLTWAFTFPGSPYFAGYRELSTQGVHLPVLNAFKLLGSLSGDRLPVASSGALPLSELLSDGVRQQPDVDALASIDADRIQILVWNYHDDLIEVPPAAVTLRVSLPPGFGAYLSVKQERVDDTHGNAHAVWAAQGSPAAPSEGQLRALHQAMQPVQLAPERVAVAADGAASVSFELPRFGISLVTLSPASESAAADVSESSCSCQLPGASRSDVPALLPLSLGVAFQRRRFAQRACRPRRQRRNPLPPEISP